MDKQEKGNVFRDVQLSATATATANKAFQARPQSSEAIGTSMRQHDQEIRIFHVSLFSPTLSWHDLFK